MGRRAWAMVAAVIACTVAPVAPVARAAEEPPARWFLVKVTAREPTKVTGVIRFPIVRRSAGPVVLGLGEGGNTDISDFLTGRTDMAYVGLLYADDGQWSISTSSDAGGVERGLLPSTGVLEVLPNGEWAWTRPRLSPGEPWLVLAFVTNGHFTAPPFEVDPSPALHVETLTGSQSGVMTVGEPRDRGVAAAVGPAAAGAVRRDGKASRGVVGAFMTHCNCTGEWRSPDARSGAWAAARTYTEVPLWIGGAADGVPVFAGPAGDWSLAWTGVMSPHPAVIALYGALPPIVAAWAPIGPDWTYFRNVHPGLIVH